MGQSLFKACRNIYRSGTSGTQPVGNYDIDFELYKQSDIDANIEAIRKGEATGCTFGDANESKVVLVMDNEVTIPSDFTLTPVHPKKSLVICCNTFENNGTISMTAKGPNVEPHDWLILGKSDNYGESNDILISAYANNQVPSRTASYYDLNYAYNGNNGINRKCGSGGHGCKFTYNSKDSTTVGASGSGYAFGGGAGSGGVQHNDIGEDVNSIYPMRGGPGGHTQNNDKSIVTEGGVGYPRGDSYRNHAVVSGYDNNSGVGGRVVIFCNEFINNGTISVNGVDCKYVGNNTPGGNNCDTPSGGASGGGAVDIFYYTLTAEGTITATGGVGASLYSYAAAMGGKSGNGGNGCITLLNWTIETIVKPQEKYMSKDNMIYFLQQLVNKINGDN